MADEWNETDRQQTRKSDQLLRLGQSDVKAILRKNYAQVQYVLVDFLAEHLADTSRAFGGDMQKAVLLAIIGQAHLSAEHAAVASGRRVTDYPPEKRGMTTLRLSDSSAIPRETVRRKLIEMERAGWLLRESGFWVLNMVGQDSAARFDLAEVDDNGITRVARLVTLLMALIGQSKRV